MLLLSRRRLRPHQPLAFPPCLGLPARQAARAEADGHSRSSRSSCCFQSACLDASLGPEAAPRLSSRPPTGGHHHPASSGLSLARTAMRDVRAPHQREEMAVVPISSQSSSHHTTNITAAAARNAPSNQIRKRSRHYRRRLWYRPRPRAALCQARAPRSRR